MAVAVVLVIIALITSLVVIYGIPMSKIQPPTLAPMTERKKATISIREQLVAVVGEKLLSDPASLVALAAD
jgi:hypothetical protein